MNDSERDFLSGWTEATKLLYHCGTGYEKTDPEWWKKFNENYAREQITEANEYAKLHPSMRFVYAGRIAANMSAFGEDAINQAKMESL